MDSFLALADPTRRQLLETLAAGESSFGDLAARFEMSAPAVSQHLKVLREAGLVSVRKQAQRRIYRLEAEGFGPVDGWLQKIRPFWNDRLDRLQRALEDESTTTANNATTTRGKRRRQPRSRRS